MKYTFEVACFLEIEDIIKEGKPKSLRTARFNLEVSDNLLVSAYKDKDENYTKEGCIALRETLISAVAANIHYAHQNGLIDSAEHIREAIKSLEALFIQNGDISRSILDNGKFIDEEDGK